MNKLVLTGYICRDIETNYYNDRKYIKNSIAVRRDFKNKDGEYDTDFFNFIIWGNQAEYIEKYAHKGDKICIAGKILNNNYEKDGQMIYSFDVQVENIELINTKGAENQSVSADKIEDIENTAKEIFGSEIVETTDKKETASLDDLF